MLFQLPNRALVLEQISDEKKSERAKTEEGHAEGPFAADRVEKYERVHESGQTTGENQDKNYGENRKLQFAAFQTIQLNAIESSHTVFPELLADFRQMRSRGRASVRTMVEGRNARCNGRRVLLFRKKHEQA